jgi:hypothetical protein
MAGAIILEPSSAGRLAPVDYGQPDHTALALAENVNLGEQRGRGKPFRCLFQVSQKRLFASDNCLLWQKRELLRKRHGGRCEDPFTLRALGLRA